jgi:hypothetical protein
MTEKPKDKFWQKRKLLIGLTTNSNWQSKLQEISDLKIEEIALFLTGILFQERQLLFKQLSKTAVKRIPVVHLKSDMAPSEIEYLLKKYQVQAFNLHGQEEYKITHNLNKFKKLIYIENAVFPWRADEVDQYGGICLDFQHLERAKISYPDKYRKEIDILNQGVQIGFNHVSPLIEDKTGKFGIGHTYSNLNQFDYLNNFPTEYFSKYMALELENSIDEQIKAKAYIAKLLEDKI